MKMLMLSITMSASLAILGLMLFFYMDYTSTSKAIASPQNVSSSSEQSSSEVAKIPAKKLAEQTVEFKELTANLAEEGSYIMLSLSAVTDDDKSAEELQKREFQLRNFMIQELSQVTGEQMNDVKFVQSLIQQAKSYMNTQMDKGTVLDIYVTNKLLQ